MNILWVSPLLPYHDAPHAGGRAVAQWIAAAAARHSVTLLTRVEPPERGAAEALPASLAAVHAQEFGRPVERLQRRICRKFDRVLTMPEHDRRTLLASAPRLSVGILPPPISIDPAKVVAPARDAAGLLFVGAMYRDANTDAMSWFCEAILPRVRAAVPDAALTIVGADPTEHVRGLAARPGVSVTGFVDVIEPCYARAAVFVAPLRIAGGVAGKTRDAMAAGCAVVTTRAGNVGLDATP